MFGGVVNVFPLYSKWKTSAAEGNEQSHNFTVAMATERQCTAGCVSLRAGRGGGTGTRTHALSHHIVTHSSPSLNSEHFHQITLFEFHNVY